MKFQKVTSSKYIGTDDYTLRKGRDGSFSIFKGGHITNWGTNFLTVKSAEIFINRHDYIKATTDVLPISSDDLEALKEIYHFKEYSPGLFRAGNLQLRVPEDFETSHQVLLVSSTKTDESQNVISSADTLFKTIDACMSSSVFASVCYRGTELRDIFAANDRRSTRDITRNLVRVKSSNVWGYGIEIKDKKDKVGDVYVQFKGKDGGPYGGVYVYYDVPINVWRRILSYPSKGAAIWKFLRNDFYYSKLTGDKKGKLKNAINR